MENFDTALEKFLNMLQLTKCNENILAVYLSGSYITQDYDNYSDLDILIICKKSLSEQVYNELRSSIIEKRINHYFDAKIIGEESGNQIFNSVDMPFFHHFLLNSKLIYGIDLFQNYKINQNWFYQSIQDILNKIDYIKELSLIHGKKSEIELLLYNYNKKLSIIYELLTKENPDYSSYKDLMLERYDINYLGYLRKKIKKNRNFISYYKYEKNRGMGFNKIKINNSKIQNFNQSFQIFIEDEIYKTIQLANRCLDNLDNSLL